MERANPQRIAVRDARTGIKTSEMRASQQQALLRGNRANVQKRPNFHSERRDC